MPTAKGPKHLAGAHQKIPESLRKINNEQSHNLRQIKTDTIYLGKYLKGFGEWSSLIVGNGNWCSFI